MKGSSLHRRLIVYFGLVAVSIILIFSLLLIVFGIDGNQKNAIYTYMSGEMRDISEQIRIDTGKYSLLGISMAEKLRDKSEAFFAREQITPEELKNNPQLITPLLSELAEQLLNTIENNTCSGVYVLLDAAATQSENARAGIFIKKTSPVTISPMSAAPHYLRGPASVARENGIELLGQWKMEFDISGEEFFTEVMENARNNPELPLSRLYYWSSRVLLQGNSEYGFLLCVPLRNAEGSVYGVAGIEVSDIMFKSMYCPTESSYSYVCTAVAPKEGNLLKTSEGFIAGNHYLTGHRFYFDLTPSEGNDGFQRFTGGATFFGGFSAQLQLYPSGSVYEQQEWGIALLLPSENLQDAIQGNSAALLFITITLLIISLFASYFIGRFYLRPVNKAFDRIKNEPHTEIQSFGYSEIDELFEFLAEKERQHKNEFTRVIGNKKQEIDPESYQLFTQMLHTLTKKEREIFNLYLDGKSAKEILDIAHINENTLKYHNKNIYSKLGVPSRKVLLQYAEIMRNESEENK